MMKKSRSDPHTLMYVQINSLLICVQTGNGISLGLRALRFPKLNVTLYLTIIYLPLKHCINIHHILSVLDKSHQLTSAASQNREFTKGRTLINQSYIEFVNVMMVISIPQSITAVNRWTKFSEKEKIYIQVNKYLA